MKSMDVNLEKVLIEVINLTGQGSEQVGSEIPFTPRAKLSLKQSADEANQLGHNYIGTEHLLL